MQVRLTPVHCTLILAHLTLVSDLPVLSDFIQLTVKNKQYISHFQAFLSERFYRAPIKVPIYFFVDILLKNSF